MNPIRKRRLLLILAGLAALGVAAGLVLTALSENLQHFVSPTDIVEGKAPSNGKRFRLGGVVLEGSVVRSTEALQNEFVVTDRFQQQKVQYNGILPDLFREGQSVVATGMMEGNLFVASEVLAKHDENYMPTEVADAIKRAKEKQDQAGAETTSTPVTPPATEAPSDSPNAAAAEVSPPTAAGPTP